MTFHDALEHFVTAAEALHDAWVEAERDSYASPAPTEVTRSDGYPTYLPSFDEFVHDLVTWRDRQRDALVNDPLSEPTKGGTNPMTDHQSLPTPEAFVALFAKHDLQPDPQVYLTHISEDEADAARYCGCAVGALFVDGYGDVALAYAAKMRDATLVLNHVRDRYGVAAAIGLNEGFTTGTARDDTYYTNGFSDMKNRLAEIRAAETIGIRARELVLAWWETRERPHLFSVEDETAHG